MSLPIFQSATTWFPLDRRTQVELTGRDRAKFLHNFCTQEIKNLAAGQACEAFITNVKGRILGHIWVFATETSLWIDTVPDQAGVLLPHLDKYLITEEVEFHDRTETWTETFVSGPNAVAKLSEVGINATSLSAMQHTADEWRERPLQLRRVDWFGGPGFLLNVPSDHAAALRTALDDAGVSCETPEEFEALRIRLGLPHYGIDLTDDNLAQEAARTRSAINFKKGCYLGQEPIARIDALGHVNRELRSLEIDSADVPPAGTPVFSDAEGKAAGTITSASHSETDGKTYALALLQSRFASPRTILRIGQPAGPRANVFWIQAFG